MSEHKLSYLLTYLQADGQTDGRTDEFTVASTALWIASYAVINNEDSG